ncbi:anti-sigma-I factor RsgI6-like isoform X2 [Littorina saxatilis]|uniref:anti-sigma-I factor RsgI6-like isoform X2 n=1 Tax=Littorina saxatilis TaxID=31220 RepID=UPI0038B5594A
MTSLTNSEKATSTFTSQLLPTFKRQMFVYTFFRRRSHFPSEPWSTPRSTTRTRLEGDIVTLSTSTSTGPCRETLSSGTPLNGRRQGERNFQPPLELIHRLRSHGIKVRGHNLIWSVEKYVQGWVKQLTGDTLRHAVQHHIQDTMNVTRGLLEHWDVNNENIHGHWYEQQLHDPDYNLEVFRIAHNADPTMKLFLNDYGKYLAQAKQVKAANLGLFGIGVQCHFRHEADPDPDAIKQRLDTLAQAGLPIWVTELDVSVHDQDTRADFLERALRAVYGHPAVEGILLWGFWDVRHWRGPNSALVKGDNLDLLPAGRRFLDLVENQWMTDETHVLSQSRDTYTVRGFHGDYELHVIYQGHDLANLTKTFTLGKTDHTINVDVHV